MQKKRQFTLILKDVDENTLNLEDSLYEAGCDDALINFRAGAVYLDFHREADSLEQAVLSAIDDVESASVKPIVINIAPDDLVTEAEIAKRLNAKRQAISLWIKGERRSKIPFPKPIKKLTDKSPFWKWSEITKWLYNNHKIDKTEVEEAIFIEDLNAVLEQRDAKTGRHRSMLLKKLKDIPSLSQFD